MSEHYEIGYSPFWQPGDPLPEGDGIEPEADEDAADDS